MSLTLVATESPDFRASTQLSGLVTQVNDVLAALEITGTTPGDILADVFSAYQALNRASLALLDRAISTSAAKSHYTAMADESKGFVFVGSNA